MINKLIKNNKKLVGNFLFAVLLLSALYILAFSEDTFQQRLSAIGLSCIAELITAVMVYFILWIQVKNPFFTKKILNLFCDIFIYFALIALMVFLISLIAYRDAFTLISISLAEGTIAGSILFKRKYVLTEK